MAFFKFLIELCRAPPPWLRMVNKRGTFFAPLDPRRPPSTSLPKLLKQCARMCSHASFCHPCLGCAPLALRCAAAELAPSQDPS